MFKDVIKNSKFYDLRFEFQNLNNDKLLDKATGQHLLIQNYEQSLTDKIDQIVELKQKLDKMTSKYYIQKDKNKKLEDSLFSLNTNR